MAIGNMYIDEELSAVWWPFHEIKGRTYLVIDRFQPDQVERLLNGRLTDFFKTWAQDPYFKLMVVTVNLPLPSLLDTMKDRSVVPLAQLEPYLDGLACINTWGRNEVTLADVQQNLSLVRSIRMVTLNLGFLSMIQKMPPDWTTGTKKLECWH